MNKVMLLVLACFSMQLSFAQTTTEEIMEKVKGAFIGRNISGEVTVVSTDKKGEQKEKTFEFLTAEVDKVQKLKLVFTAPERAKGIMMKTTITGEKSDFVAIYMPSTGRIRKIKSTSSRLSLLGSSIDISSITPGSFSEYTLFLEADSLYKGEPCFVIKAVPDAVAKYRYVIILIAKHNYAIQAILLYDTKGKEVQKTILEEYRQVANGLHYPSKVQIINVQKGEKTLLKMNNLKELSNPKESDFELPLPDKRGDKE